MMEMACVSFDKVRLQFYVKKGKRRAKIINQLLEKPATLFGVTLLGVNISLQVGSECARRFYLALGLSPDFAPLTQTIVVLLFAEGVPLFAGRRYAEHVAMLGAPIIYFFSLLFWPLIMVIEQITRFVNWLIRVKARSPLEITLEEFQKVLEEHEEGSRPAFSEEDRAFKTCVANIFSLKGKVAKDLMETIAKVRSLEASSKVGKARRLLSSSYSTFIPVYKLHLHDIVAIIYPRDLLRLDDEAKIEAHWKAPWMIAENSPLLDILAQFRQNSQSVGVVLNAVGETIGFLTLDGIIDVILGLTESTEGEKEVLLPYHDLLIERSFPGKTKVAMFYKQLGPSLQRKDGQTLEELLEELQGGTLIIDSPVRMGSLELTLVSDPIIGQRKIYVKTLS